MACLIRVNIGCETVTILVVSFAAALASFAKSEALVLAGFGQFDNSICGAKTPAQARIPPVRGSAPRHGRYEQNRSTDRMKIRRHPRIGGKKPQSR